MHLIMLNVKNNFMYIKKNMSWVENKIYLVRTYLQQVQASVHVFFDPAYFSKRGSQFNSVLSLIGLSVQTENRPKNNNNYTLLGQSCRSIFVENVIFHNWRCVVAIQFCCILPI